MNISKFVTYDFPVLYKELEIHPVRLIDYELFNIGSLCLTVEKNLIPDPKIISMTDLEYIFYSSTNLDESPDKIPYLYCFDRLLSLVIKDGTFEDLEKSFERYNYDSKGKPTFRIGDIWYDSNDFDELKKIISEQNMVELPDENISKEVRDSLEKAREYKRRLSGEKPATTEDYIVALGIATGWELESIYNMTIRKFLKSVERLDNLIHYKIYLSASMSGMVEFKDKSFIKHWLSNLEKDKYGDVSIDYSALQGKVSFEDAKKK
jgi:hypothetical protein